jgi:hypothetical protein
MKFVCVNTCLLAIRVPFIALSSNSYNSPLSQVGEQVIQF